MDDKQSEFLPDGRYRGTENLPDQGWTANIFNRRVHPQSHTVGTVMTIILLVFAGVGLIAGAYGLVVQGLWTGEAFLLALVGFLGAFSSSLVT